MRLGDLDDLKDHIGELLLVYSGEELANAILNAIDNAPTVADRYDEGFRDGYAKCTNDREERKEHNRLFGKERPHSKWVKIFENPFTNGYVCPFCGHKIQVTEQFLPKVTECEACGADMRGEKE